MRLPRAIFRYVEHELYHYDETQKELQELRQEIVSISASPGFVIVNENNVSDSVARKVVKLVTNTAIARMTRTLAAIDKALMRLTEHHRQVFELRYRKHLPWQEICQEMSIDRSTYFRYRSQLVFMVAVEMGLVKHT